MRGYVRQIDAMDVHIETLQEQIRNLQEQVNSLKVENEILLTKGKLPPVKAQIIDALAAGARTTNELYKKIKSSKYAIRSAVYDLHQMGVLTRTGPHTFYHGRSGIEYYYYIKR